MPVIKVDTMSTVGTVRIRAAATDPHAVLRGHAYIQARGLDKPIERLAPDAHSLAAGERLVRRIVADHMATQHRATVLPLIQKRRPT